MLTDSYMIGVGMDIGGVSVVTEDTLGVKQTHMMMVATNSPRDKDVTNVTANVIAITEPMLMEAISEIEINTAVES